MGNWWVVTVGSCGQRLYLEDQKERRYALVNAQGWGSCAKSAADSSLIFQCSELEAEAFQDSKLEAHLFQELKSEISQSDMPRDDGRFAH